MDETTNLLLPYILAAQAQKHVTHNEALRKLDALVQISIVDRDLATPPASPADGARYIVAASPTGAWVGHTGKIAAWQDGAWAFYAPRTGRLAWIEDEASPVAWNGTAWTLVGGGSVNPVPLVGVNATADTTNRLAVSSPASLFNHAGAGHQAKINKNAATDTASILFQTGFSGRAEMGTTGSDDYAFKVSPNGSAWFDAILINRTNGAVTFPNTSLGGGISDGDKGDVIVSASGATWTVDAGTITNAKLANMPTGRIKGRVTAGSGPPEDLTAVQVRALLSTRVESAPIALTVTNDSASVFLHGLGTRPAKYGYELECKVANNGYAVGDRIQHGGFRSTSFLVTLSADATNITLSWDANIPGILYFAPKAGGTAILPLATQWDLILWAEA